LGGGCLKAAASFASRLSQPYKVDDGD